jgi:hypothetical protein
MLLCRICHGGHDYFLERLRRWMMERAAGARAFAAKRYENLLDAKRYKNLPLFDLIHTKIFWIQRYGNLLCIERYENLLDPRSRSHKDTKPFGSNDTKTFWIQKIRKP